VGELDVELVSIVNLLLCLAITVIGLVGYRRSKHRMPLMLALIFAIFGLSHALVLMGTSGELDTIVYALRILAYGLVIYLLYRYVRILDIF
jgi:uncharacterized membrane protein